VGLTSLELFAGAGGMALGLHRAGIHAAALVEYAADPCATLRAEVAAGRLSGEVIEGDAGAVDFSRWRGVDLVCGGVPCQDWSQAGQRAGASGTRNLWPDFIRAVVETSSRWVLAENVTRRGHRPRDRPGRGPLSLPGAQPHPPRGRRWAAGAGIVLLPLP